MTEQKIVSLVIIGALCLASSVVDEWLGIKWPSFGAQLIHKFVFGAFVWATAKW